jgi:hypothetical protein
MLKQRFVILAALISSLISCNPPKLAKSRLRSGSPAVASVSIFPPTDAAGLLTFVHNHPDVGPDQFKMTSLTVSVPAATSAVTIDPASTKVSLPALKFAVSMVATASPRKLTCQSAGIPMGTSAISCTVESASSNELDANKSPDMEIANYIVAKKTDISTALKNVKDSVFGGAEYSPAVLAHWQQLEKDAKVGGGMNGAPDALASVIRSWNAGLDFEAEKVAFVLVQVYQEGYNASTKNPDQEIAKHIVTQKSSIADALYFVKTNIINAELPSAVLSRWSNLEIAVKSFNGEVEATTRQIETWNIDLGYSAESIASAMAANYK